MSGECEMIQSVIVIISCGFNRLWHLLVIASEASSCQCDAYAQFDRITFCIQSSRVQSTIGKSDQMSF